MMKFGSLVILMAVPLAMAGGAMAQPATPITIDSMNESEPAFSSVFMSAPQCPSDHDLTNQKRHHPALRFFCEGPGDPISCTEKKDGSPA